VSLVVIGTTNATTATDIGDRTYEVSRLTNGAGRACWHDSSDVPELYPLGGSHTSSAR
jgi:hypothetical protein